LVEKDLLIWLKVLKVLKLKVVNIIQLHDESASIFKVAKLTS